MESIKIQQNRFYFSIIYEISLIFQIVSSDTVQFSSNLHQMFNER